MVSFNCDACGDVVKKPKLLQHYNRCYAPVTCLDCSMQFNSPNEFKSHNSCISEAEKYQKTVYKGPGGAKGAQQRQLSSNAASSPGKPSQHETSNVATAPSRRSGEEAEDATAASTSESPSKKDKKDKRKRDDAAGVAESEAATEPKVDDDREVKKAKKAEEKGKKGKKGKKDKKDKQKDKKDKKKDKEVAAATGTSGDDRFDLSKFEKPTPAKVLAGPASDAGGDAGGDDDDDDEGEHEQDDPMDEDKVIKPLNAEELEAFKKKQRKLGIIYISRIPPGMTPAKVRHILSNFGEVGRMYLKDGNQKPGEYGKSKKRSSAFYTEGWVEFLSKKVAKATAEMLNAQPIGALAASKSKNGGLLAGGVKAGKNTKRFQDEVWTMKYLKGFKWHMLSEQMAQERASLTARMRTEMSQSAYEQNDYLRKVERAKMQKYKADKKRKRAEEKGEALPADTAPEKGFKTFKQKQPVVKDVRDQREAEA
ncbi:uncharacterized protein PFL1_04437 [Pseudozyma flocculosa PF-1]|uniref:18S rRNA factor 2 n=2 Tax=Pseudozyma flocculosa TaxID=84751 RepID=A0A5C3FE40_9BASI|nr:uncharacterized protein PFL1_04437 [Pseudozyma flocculosa PF-1]EPQ28110.1 hypothetical protein PFL1_04437 [Pseudozyma flocculosa PF-1]SPO41907.1 related to ESF2 - essential nucleolar protein involved in pre-18S rRNA processing [Pseudozyma flocculosa]